MSTLKVNKIRDNSGSTDAIVLDPNGGAVLAGVTTVTSVKVGTAVTISESGIEASGIGITCANINGTQIGGRRNIIINGAMNVAQRNTSSTSTGMQTVDRFNCSSSGTDETPTQAQADVASGTTPYTLGFRKSFKITNGNQTGGAGATDYIHTSYSIEDQDLAQSGWNYTSSSSFVTLSYWVKSSVAQNFYLYLQSDNSSQYRYTMETGSLTANTWKKVTFTIPGNSNIVLNNDNGVGMYIVFSVYDGTDRTGKRPLNAWAALDNTTRTPDQATTWYLTNDATFEMTGIQLEVGSQATAYEHRTFGEELALCQRYFETSYPSGYSAGHNFNDVYPFNTSKPVAQNYIASDDTLTSVSYPFMVNKRASPTVTIYSAKDGASGNAHTYKGTGGTDLNVALNVIQTREQQMMLGCSLGAVNQANEMYFHYTAESEL